MVYYCYFVWLLHGSSAYQHTGSSLFLMDLYHLYGTQVNLSARLQFDVTKVIHRQFIFGGQFLDGTQPPSYKHFSTHPGLACQGVQHPQWYMHKESVCIWTFFIPNWSTRLMPFSTASSSARLICEASFIAHSQHASLITVLFFSNKTQITKELASTQMFISFPCTHQSPLKGSFIFTLVMVSITIWTSKVSVVSLSQPFATVPALHYIVIAAMQSHPHTGRCPTSQPTIQRKNSTSCQDVRYFWNQSSAPPLQGSLHSMDIQTQYTGAIFQQFQVLTNQTKLGQFLSYNIFIHMSSRYFLFLR